ncbi:DUF624 domain-containing protein [Arthrobacter sp. ISL-48]|uniref:YesL family protein n=1 Tax=Arthrobacter sp. ISL-48 TaxID=2819110 RepID=UPI001BE9363D|nr:DUF624 domain-containing protein [Arthrobacter sp. ISL-48]MBT2533373.1 DUF624 domain-containing protein [Arthrobacter sp. ISL-48]
MNDSPLGWAGRVMEWLGFAARLVLVNVLFVAGTLAGLVVFGLFPAAVAATTVLARLRSGGAGEHLVRDFVTVYRFQFWHVNRVGSIFWLAGVVLFLNYLTLPGRAGAAMLSSPIYSVLLLLAAVVGVGMMMAAATAVAVCSRYRDSATRTWRTAFMLPLVSPVMGISLLMSLVAFAVVFSGMTVLVPLVGASVPLLISGWLVGRRLEGLETAPSTMA